MTMKALILVDVQNDFTVGGALEVPGGDGIIEPINRIQERFELVIATQDWHPSDHASFASNHKGKEPFDVIDLHGIEQTLWPDHCVQGSKGAQFHPGLETNRIEAIFRKGMAREIDSYSGFYDNGHQRTTGLTGYLREKGAENLYFSASSVSRRVSRCWILRVGCPTCSSPALAGVRTPWASSTLSSKMAVSR